MGKMKRRRDEDDEEDSIDDGDDDASLANDVNDGKNVEDDPSGINDDIDDKPREKKKKKVRKLKVSATEDFNAKLQKRGIVYISRVPPRMTPSKVKTLLSDFGTITRVYLVEEDKTVRKKRRKAGGSGGKRYTEGWVEFESKKKAKEAGEALNMNRMTNHKGSMHYDDFWNIKFLKGFKWSHLTEKVAYERRVREQKLRIEMMEVKRENASYIAQVEAGKKLDHIEERLRKRQDKEGGASAAGNKDAGQEKKRRKIKQKKPFQGDEKAGVSLFI
jgi:ESF2/ABP1 family protein